MWQAIIAFLTVIGGFTTLGWKWLKAARKAEKYERQFKEAADLLHEMSGHVINQEKALREMLDEANFWRREFMEAAPDDELIAAWNRRSLFKAGNGKGPS